MTRQSMSVLGREVFYDSVTLDISTLEYYVENPRINYIISTHEGPVSQELIETKLLALDSTKDLIRDIESNHGLLEEVLVVGNQVVEGNTRLAAYRRLSQRFPNDDAWLNIPAKVLDGVSDEELFFILGTFHIKGKNEWGAYEKAAYIHRMVRNLNKTPQEVARQLGHQAGTVEAILLAYEAMSTVFLPRLNPESDDFETQDALRKYSYFEAFFRTKDLAERAQVTPEFVSTFSDWVAEGVFPRAADVRELPKILSHKRSLDVFLETVEDDPGAAFQEATLKLNEAKPEKVDPFYKRVREFRDMIRETPPQEVREEILQANQFGKTRRTELARCYREFCRFCEAVGIDD